MPGARRNVSDTRAESNRDRRTNDGPSRGRQTVPGCRNENSIPRDREYETPSRPDHEPLDFPNWFRAFRAVPVNRKSAPAFLACSVARRSGREVAPDAYWIRWPLFRVTQEADA